MLLMYAFFFMVSNFYGAGAVGIYSLSMAVLNIAVVFCHWGYHSAALRYISEFEAKKNWLAIGKTYQLSLKIPLILSVLASFIIYYFADFIGEIFFGEVTLTESIQLVAYSVVPLTLLLIHFESLRALRKIKESAFLQNVAIQFLSILMLFFPMYLNIQDNNMPFLTRVIAHALVAVYCLWYWAKIARKENQKYQSKAPESQNHQAINLHMMTMMALPLFLASSTRLILDWTDTIMLGIFRTEDEVGIYNTALKVAMITGLPLIAVNSIAAPKFSALYHKGEFTEFKRYVQLATQLNFYATLPMLILLAVIPNFILGLFGEEFIVGRNTLWMLLLGQLANTFSGSVGYILQMTNRQNTFQKLILGGAVINIILNYLLIPKMGISGAAIASTISTAFWNFGGVLYIYHNMKVVTYFRPSLPSLLRLLKKYRNTDV